MTDREKVEACLKTFAAQIGGEVCGEALLWKCREHSAGSHICAVVSPYQLTISCGRISSRERAELIWIAFPEMGGRA